MSTDTIKKSKFEKALEEGKFVVTCEIDPPKGTEKDEIKETAEYLRDIADGINVTDLGNSIMKLGSLTICHLLKEWGFEPIYQVNCRDKNRLALQADLLSAYVLGIRNVLAITGDHTTLGDHPQAEPVFDLDSVQLLWAIKNLEEGRDLAGNNLTEKPAFFKGAVVNPGADSEASFELQIIKMKKKIEQGAQFFQTHAIFDADVFKKFIERTRRENIKVPILAGIILLKSEKMARHMNKFVPGIFVPELIIKKIENTTGKTSISIEMASALIEQIKPYCNGIHIRAMGWEKHIPAVVRDI